MNQYTQPQTCAQMANEKISFAMLITLTTTTERGIRPALSARLRARGAHADDSLDAEELDEGEPLEGQRTLGRRVERHADREELDRAPPPEVARGDEAAVEDDLRLGGRAVELDVPEAEVGGDVDNAERVEQEVGDDRGVEREAIVVAAALVVGDGSEGEGEAERHDEHRRDHHRHRHVVPQLALLRHRREDAAVARAARPPHQDRVGVGLRRRSYS